MEVFNLQAYPQLLKALGPIPETWDLAKAPVRVIMRRPKTGVKFYNYVPRKLIEYIRGWLRLRKQIAGSEIRVFFEQETQTEISDPIFLTRYGTPISELMAGKIVRESSFKSGVQKRKIWEEHPRYRIHSHEFRDTFRTTCKIAKVDSAVAEFFIGHSIDKYHYEKSL